MILVSQTSQLKYYRGELLNILLDFAINDGNETGSEQNIISEQKLKLLRNALVIIKCNINKNKSNRVHVCIWTLQVSLTVSFSFSDSWSLSDWSSAQCFKLVLIFTLAERSFFLFTFSAFVKLSSSLSPSFSNLLDNLRFLIVHSRSFLSSDSGNLRFCLASLFSVFSFFASSSFFCRALWALRSSS